MLLLKRQACFSFQQLSDYMCSPQVNTLWSKHLFSYILKSIEGFQHRTALNEKWGTFRTKCITYVSVEHVVCSPKSDIVEQDVCYCIDSLKNQIHFLPLSTEVNIHINTVRIPTVNNSQKTDNVNMYVSVIISNSYINHIQKCLT